MIARTPVLLTIVGSWLTLAGCLSDAPRDNPFDPESNDYESASAVTGRVTNRLGVSVADARVELQSEHYETLSNAQGRFTFEGVPAGTLSVMARKSGFAPAIDSVVIQFDERKNVLLPLNAIPQFDSVSVYAAHTLRFFFPATYELTVETQVHDPDELPGLDSVRVLVRGEAIPLERVESGRYARSFRASELPAEDLHALEGEPLRIEATDKEGHRAQSAPRSLARVIDPSPIADTTLFQNDSLRFQWEPAEGDAAPYPFPHTYRVTLVRREGDFDVRVARYARLSAQRTSLRVESPERPGDYYWTVAVVDAYGDVSRSRPNGFTIDA